MSEMSYGLWAKSEKYCPLMVHTSVPDVIRLKKLRKDYLLAKWKHSQRLCLQIATYCIYNDKLYSKMIILETKYIAEF